MNMLAIAVLFSTALVLPVVLFLLFRPRNRAGRILATVVAVAAGWAFNVACIVAVEAIDPGSLGGDGDNLAVVTSFGWVCPLVTVLVTWLVWHLLGRRRG